MRRNMGRRVNVGNTGGGGGPLMTGHLKDIDLELELLKRKREMIEQQQQLLVMEQQFQSRHSYDPMRFDEPPQHGLNRDFTHMYDSGPKQRNQFGRKRPAEPQWQYEGAAKKPSKKKSNPQLQFNQYGKGNTGPGNVRNQRPNQGPRYNPKPAPLMDVKIKQPTGQKKPPPKSSSNVAPSKASKSKASPVPNKAASQSVTERNSLVADANESASDADVSRMLLPDRVPTQQVSGRLELALGAIMKNIRKLIDKDNSPRASMLRSLQLQRLMKQAVRERIRAVMLGKVVGSLLDILAIYREKYPEDTDIDIVNMALEAGGLPLVPAPQEKSKFIESDNPGDFYKMNMTCLLETKLNEMLTDLEELYGQKPAEENENGKGSEENTENNPQLPKTNEEHANSQEYKEFLNTNLKVTEVKRFLPRLMKRYVPFLLKLMNVDAMFKTTKAGITMMANEKAAAICNKKDSEEGQGDGENVIPASESENSNQTHNLPYYVKIMGRPTLPRKKQMQAFLNQFNPKSIKKHRTIHNLLFVGFSDKNDFNVIVGANGTVIGRSTLSVRICTKNKDSAGGQNGENAEIINLTADESQDEIKNEDLQDDIKNEDLQDEVKNEKCQDDDFIAADLDGQITDLLSSIRKEEETKETGEDIDNNTEENDCKNTTEADIETLENQDSNVNENATIATEKDTEGGEKALEEEKVSEEPDIQNVEGNADNLEEANDLEMTDVTDVKLTENTSGSEKTEANGDEAQKDSEQPPEENSTTEELSNDKVEELKGNATGRSTPMRTSTRLANVTPSSIRTRRASRLMQN